MIEPIKNSTPNPTTNKTQIKQHLEKNPPIRDPLYTAATRQPGRVGKLAALRKILNLMTSFCHSLELYGTLQLQATF